MWGSLVVLCLPLVWISCGNDPWMPDHYPAYVVIVDELTDEQLAAVQDAGAAWNKAYGAEILHVVYAPGQHRACHQINVELGEVPDDKNGTTSWEWLSCGTVVRISAKAKLNEDDFRTVTTHEFGHALGLHHVSEKADIMYPDLTDPPGHITKRDLEAVRETVEAAGGAPAE